MQKMSDTLLSVCPECGKETYVKMLSAAGFQLKGSGWYQSDFKGGAKPKEEAAAPAAAPVPPCAGGGCCCAG